MIPRASWCAREQRCERTVRPMSRNRRAPRRRAATQTSLPRLAARPALCVRIFALGTADVLDRLRRYEKKHLVRWND